MNIDNNSIASPVYGIILFIDPLSSITLKKVSIIGIYSSTSNF